MGVFDHFPYTNFHELNLDWIVSEIKKLVTEYEKLNGLFADFEALKEWVENYFNDADFLDDIEAILLQMVQDNIINVANVNFESVKVLNGNNVLEMLENSLYMQGGCYVENGIFVYAAVSYQSDNNDLVAVDMNNGTELWRYTLPIYHANAIAFRKSDRKLYIAACQEAGSSVLMNKILVVDYDNPSAVIDTITSPARGDIFSLAYDSTTDTFYSSNYTGANAGEADYLFQYNGIFSSVEAEIKLIGDYCVDNKPGHDNQGVQCVHNNVAWIVYTLPTRILAAFDVKTGKKIAAYTVPTVFNGYSEVGEMQFMTNNGDDYYLGYATPHHNTGIKYMHKYCIAEIPVVHNVGVQQMDIGNLAQPGGAYTCKLDRNRISKYPNYRFTNFSSWNDIITFAKWRGIRPLITFEQNATHDYELFTPDAWDIEFVITVPETGYGVTITGSYFSSIKAIFQSVTFNGQQTLNGFLVNGVRSYNQPDNVSFWGNSDVVLNNCSFTAITGNARAIGVYEGSHVTLNGTSTFNNTYMDIIALNGSRVTDNSTINSGVIGVRDTDISCDGNSTVDNMVLLGRYASHTVGSTDIALTNPRANLADNKVFVVAFNNGGASWSVQRFQKVASSNVVTMRIVNTGWTVDLKVNVSTNKFSSTLVSGTATTINITIGYISD